MTKANKKKSLQGKKTPSVKTKITVTGRPQSETSLMDSTTGQAWERGISFPTSKNKE